MPAVSQAQRAYLFMKFGKAWAKKHHFDNKGRLPAHARAKGHGKQVARRMRG